MYIQSVLLKKYQVVPPLALRRRRRIHEYLMKAAGPSLRLFDGRGEMFSSSRRSTQMH